MVVQIFLKLIGGASVYSRFSRTPKIVKHKNSGAIMQIISAILPYAIVVLPPMAMSPTVNMGMRTLASVPPMPANKVARDAN